MKPPREFLSLGRIGGQPTILRDGRPVVEGGYCSCGAMWPDRWRADHEAFLESGWKVFWLSDTGGVLGDWAHTEVWNTVAGIPGGLLPEGHWGLDAQAEWILARQPEARFWVRMNDLIPRVWTDSHADQLQTDAMGTKRQAASLASLEALTLQAVYVHRLGEFCDRMNWSDRILGLVLFPIAEGQTQLACEGWLFDQAPVMQEAFRAHLSSIYRTDSELRRAWSNDHVSLGDAGVPDENSFFGKDRLPFWPPAHKVQRARDYFDLQRRLFHRYLRVLCGALRETAGPGRLTGIDAFKGTMAGWLCGPTFSGRGWLPSHGDGMLSSGAGSMAEQLDACDVDMVVTPHDYRRRWAGAGFSPEGIGDSVVLRGKIMLIEEDQRTEFSSEAGLFGSPRADECEAIFHRNFFASLARGHQNYPMDVCGGYFRDDSIQGILRQRAALEEKLRNFDRSPVASVVQLVDPDAGQWTNFSSEYGDLAIIRQRIWGLDHCGVPTKCHLIEDIGREDFPACHRLFLLPNLFFMNEDRAAHLRKALFRDGNVLVFGPGTAMTDGGTPSPRGAADLLGIPFELCEIEYPRFVTIDQFTHPLTRGASAAETYGDTLRYGPVLLPRDLSENHGRSGAAANLAIPENPQPSTFARLGSIALDSGKRRPGLVVAEFGLGATGNGRSGQRGVGDYAVVFTTALPLPVRLLRELARWSGTHVWNETDDFTTACRSLVAVHALRPGPRVISLSGPHRISDPDSGAIISEASDRIVFHVDAPCTKAFHIQPVQ